MRWSLGISNSKITIFTRNVDVTFNSFHFFLSSTVVDHSARHVFFHKGFVVTEVTRNLDASTEDAISVGAEDVEEIEDAGEKFLKVTETFLHHRSLMNKQI